MSRDGKDSSEVVRFMTLFARLKEWSDDAPDDLAELAVIDTSIKELCIALHSAACYLKQKERWGRKLFAAPVDPSFLNKWRDYEERYESAICDVFLSDLAFDLGDEDSDGQSKADVQWTLADNEAVDLEISVDVALNFARFNADQDHRWDESQQVFIETIQNGVDAWKRLKSDVGLDLRGVFRRRELIPFVLIPRTVSNRQGSTDRLSMLKNLQQAHDAFVYGATYAALALMRSIMESVLRDHYAATGTDLSERIRNAKTRLPRASNEASLQRLRKLANAVLHLDKEKDEGLPKMDEVRLEKEIISLLFVLRALIEGAN